MKIAGINFPDEVGVIHLQKSVGEARRIEKKSFWPPCFFVPDGMCHEKRPQPKPWHATCGKNGMARKMNVLRISQQAFGQAAISNRQPMPLTVALYLAQLRPHVLTVPPRLRRQITVQIAETPEASRVVKIIHTDSI